MASLGSGKAEKRFSKDAVVFLYINQDSLKRTSLVSESALAAITKHPNCCQQQTADPHF